MTRPRPGCLGSAYDEDDFAISKPLIEKEERQLREELDGLQRPISVLAAFPQHGRELRDAWAANGVEWQHALAKAYCRYIVYLPVGRGRRDDLGIKIVWQDWPGDPAKVVAEAIRQAKAESPRFVPHGRSRYRQGCRCEVCGAAHENDLERQRRWRRSPKRREWERQYRERNREKLLAWERDYRERNRERRRE